MMNRRFTGLTDPGLVRSANQDNFYTDPEGRFFIVADGMGGHAGGEEASKIATKRIQAYLDKYWASEDHSSDSLLEGALLEANQRIVDDQESNPKLSDMGTTVVVVIFRENQPWRAHVGDSRLYRLRNGQLEQITEDHTLVARAVKMGDMTPEEAKVNHYRHVLLQCLGRKEINAVEIAPLDVQSGDMLLLCSDGLTEEVADDMIQELFESEKSCEEIGTQLIEAAKEGGGSDNITVVIVAQD